MTKTIGGALDYAALATLHRPTDPVAIAAEIRRLHSTGLTPRDISTALRLDLAAVSQAIGADSSDAIAPHHTKAPT